MKQLERWWQNAVKTVMSRLWMKHQWYVKSQDGNPDQEKERQQK